MLFRIDDNQASWSDIEKEAGMKVEENFKARGFVVVTALVMSALAGSPGAQGATVNTLNYFANGIPGTCMGQIVGNPGSYYKTFQEPTNQCPGLTVYHQVKGGGTFPWSTESFYLYQGWIWQMNEVVLRPTVSVDTHLGE
jgi:hypothetical protein